MSQNASSGICCIQKFSDGYTPGSSHKRDNGWRGFKGTARRDKKKVRGMNRNGVATDTSLVEQCKRLLYYYSYT
jgi:hypothetical protein